ncbi:MAG: hypothetical protein AB7L84_09445 [Acidimicrobiia bacterium]
MALNQVLLSTQIVAAMAKQIPEGQTLPDEAKVFANDLAAAIHAYVTAGEVSDVRVVDLASNELAQTGTAKVK